MAARSGEQFLRGLLDDREIWVGSEKISSAVDHPWLRQFPPQTFLTDGWGQSFLYAAHGTRYDLRTP